MNINNLLMPFLLIISSANLIGMNPSICQENLRILQEKLYARGIIFIDDNGTPLSIESLDINIPQMLVKDNKHRINNTMSILEYFVSEQEYDPVILELLLQCGANVNQETSHGTILTKAARYNKAETAQFLIQHGAQVNTQGQLLTPLMAAAASGSTNLIGLFLKKNALVSALDENNCSAIHHAIMNNQEQALQLLVTSGAIIKDDKQLQQALAMCKLVSKGQSNIMNLVQALLSLQKQELQDACTKLGMPPTAAFKSRSRRTSHL